MRPYRRITRLHRGGQFDSDRRQLAALLATAFQGKADCVRMRHAAVERFADGDLQLCRAITIEQPRQACGDGAEVGAALGGAQQQVLARRSDLGEAIGGTMLARGAFVRDQGLDMSACSTCAPLS